MSRLKFATVQIVLLAAVFCLACGGLCRAANEPARPNSSEANLEQAEQEKTKVLRQVAQNWLQIGITQYSRGLYEQAEESLLAAQGYQGYLTAEEQKQLQEHLSRAQQAAVERRVVLGQIKIARALLDKGQPIKARAHYEKVRNSPYLTEQQRKQIAGEIQKVDVTLDKQMKEITELYNRSVELYRAGQLEKAREGFMEVSRYGLLIATQGQSAEDYLIQIDGILTGRRKSISPAEPTTTQKIPIIVPPAEKRENGKQQRAQDKQEEAAEVTAIAEPTATQAELALEARTKILRTYTKAVVEDTIAQVQRHVIRRDFDKAIDAVRKAADVVKKNRSFIGEESFAQYSVLLKRLVDRIIEARKSS